jgi:hypothetical protein
MVKASLVGPDVELGENILRSLDAAKFPLTVALWRFKEEEGRWTLVLGTPLYDKSGPFEAYMQLTAALPTGATLGELPIRLEGNRNPLVRSLRKIFGKAASVEGMRLGLQSIGGVWIDDAYVYRIKK